MQGGQGKPWVGKRGALFLIPLLFMPKAGQVRVKLAMLEKRASFVLSFLVLLLLLN